MYSRSKLLQFICGLAFIKHDAVVELLFQPGEVSNKSNAISNVTLTETLELHGVLDCFQVLDRRTRDSIIPLELYQLGFVFERI